MLGHQLILAALEAKGWKTDDVQIAFLAPSDAKVAYTQGSVDAWSTWEPYVSQEEVLFKSRRVITGEGLNARPRLSGRHPHGHPGQASRTRGFCAPSGGGAGMVCREREQLCGDLGQAHEHPHIGAAQLARRGRRSDLAPIDDAVIADEQTTIDLYFRAGLIKQNLKAADIVDRSFTEAIGKGAGL